MLSHFIREPRVLSSAWAIGAAALLLAGCAKPIHVIDVTDDANAWRASHAPLVHGEKLARSIVVRVIGRPSMGVVSYAAPNQTSVVPLEGEDDFESFRAILQKDRGATSGTLVKGYGSAVQTILKERLSEYFTNVTVNLSPEPPRDGATTVTPTALTLIPGFYTRTAAAELTTRTPDGASFKQQEIPETSSAAAHLAWALPLAIATFPVGVSFIGYGFAGIYKGMEEHKAIESIDMDAEKVAASLAKWTATQAPSLALTAAPAPVVSDASPVAVSSRAASGRRELGPTARK